MLYLHIESGHGYAWIIHWAYKHLEKAIANASGLGDGRNTAPLMKKRYVDQRMKLRSHLDTKRVVVDEVPYFPSFSSYPELFPDKYVLYRFPDCDTDLGAMISLLGVYSSLEDAVKEGRKLGDGKSPRPIARHTYVGGLNFDEGDASDPKFRIGVDYIGFDSELA